MTTFGQKLTKARKAKKLSAYKLAQLSGVGANHIRAMERGQIKDPGVQAVSKLARALKVSVENLVA